MLLLIIIIVVYFIILQLHILSYQLYLIRFSLCDRDFVANVSIVVYYKSYNFVFIVLYYNAIETHLYFTYFIPLIYLFIASVLCIIYFANGEFFNKMYLKRGLTLTSQYSGKEIQLLLN